MEKTEQIKCPVCGKQHTVLIHYKPSMWRLDYTPMEPVENMQLLMAHYYYECNMPQQRHACLARALQQLRAGKDTVHARLDGASIAALKLKKPYPLMGALDYVAEYRQIDVLRQLGEYDAAQQLLTKMMHHHELLPIERKFLECEHKLIQQCDSQPH